MYVSAQPVAPSFGIVSFTGALSAMSVLVWFGQDAPMIASAFLKRTISSGASAQHFFTSGFCFLSSATAASNCSWLSAYGSSIPRSGCVFERYSAASAIWMGLSGTVILPLYLGSYSAAQLVGAGVTFVVS